MFFTTAEVFIFNYYDDTKDRSTLYKLNNTLDDQPRFGVFNKDQTKFIVTSAMDILYVDIKSGKEIDLDDREEISAI